MKVEPRLALYPKPTAMEESAAQRALMELGAIWEARKLVLLHGTKLFGPPSETAAKLINSIIDVEQ